MRKGNYFLKRYNDSLTYQKCFGFFEFLMHFIDFFVLLPNLFLNLSNFHFHFALIFRHLIKKIDYFYDSLTSECCFVTLSVSFSS